MLRVAAWLSCCLVIPISAAEPKAVEELLKRPLLPQGDALLDVHDHVRSKLPKLLPPNDPQSRIKTAADWQREIDRLRAEAFAQVVFRGEAATWRNAKTKVEYLDTIERMGYRIKKLRYEILPDFWIPALLYEPDNLQGKVPVSMAVNGHDVAGKMADYKQIRCINMAKRGMIVLNVEWLGMGQLRTLGNRHGVMNQLDLCGSSGIAPFYLSMSRGLDLLLGHPNADATRVAVNGLSGGGWQTIFISGLDGRVTFSNPVAGYSSFFTRIDHHKDLGDSEQTPCDMATVLDYTHLTAMLAPRATLLTYNAKDNCCFEAGYAMEPLRAGAEPFFKLFEREKYLQTHVNNDPGDHNFGKDNRQALYKMLGTVFFPNAKAYSGDEFPCDKELLKKELDVPLPEKNLDMHTLAVRLAEQLPRASYWPTKAVEVAKSDEHRRSLAKVLRLGEILAVDARFSPRHEPKAAEVGGTKATLYQLKVGSRWTVPVVELRPAEVKGTTVLIGDQGRSALSTQATELVNAGQRVLVADLYYFGEGRPNPKDWLWSLMLATVGDRPLGLQTNELIALARWAADGKSVNVHAIGPRTSTIALCAAALETKAIASVAVVNPLGSFKQVIEENRTVDQTPELFCFGLLEQFDIRNIAALIAPRPLRVLQPSDRAKSEFDRLKELPR